VLRLPDRDRSRVVLIGTARPGRPEALDAPAVRYALPALADTFADRRLCGIAPTNVRIVLDPPDLATARWDLEQSAGHATDLLLVYLAGAVLPGADGSPELVLADATRRGGGRRSPIPRQRGRAVPGLPLSWVVHTLATCRAAVRVLVVDAVATGFDPAVLRAAVDTTVLVVCEEPGLFASHGRGTALSRPLLDLAYRRDPARPQLLRPVDIADALAEQLGDRLGYLEPPHPVPLALLRSPAGLAPVPADLRRLDRQSELVADAERLSHRPDLLADRYRALAQTAYRVHGADHPETLRLRHRLAHWTGKAGDIRAAVALYTDLHADRVRLLGANHPHSRGSEADLRYWATRVAG
jgi:hypothetical protein